MLRKQIILANHSLPPLILTLSYRKFLKSFKNRRKKLKKKTKPNKTQSNKNKIR